MKPHRGTLILVLGILSLVLCAPVGIAAWIMGGSDLKEMAAGTMDPTGRDTTKAGKICGMIGVALMVIGMVIGALFIFGLGAAISTSHIQR